MPEGPEIHREADKISNAIADSHLRYIYYYHDHLKPFEKELAEKRVENVEAFGKGLVISFEDDFHMYSHNQLYGKWYIKPAGDYPKTNRQLRAELRTDQKSALLYSASEIDVMDGESIKEHPYLSKLGPDLLKGVTVDDIVERSKSDDFRRKMFASLLLDQTFLSGVGNYLRTEILFDSKIDPSAKPKDLSDEQLIEFAKSALTITHRAYQTKGMTVADDILSEAKQNGEKRRQYRHYLFNRAGKPCRMCGTEVEKLEKSGRRIYVCRNCQGL
ncbi:endonuclease VIII [Rhodohalobacter sp. 8-1]|uniref:endonuclease VIII n=1 Tax=Rhodohalobacter sp. 8-1 TaxID=3131972 RepID=UPI0030EF95BB